MLALTVALWIAGVLADLMGDPVEMERLASDLIELTTRQNFAQFLAGGAVFRGWVRSFYGDAAEGLAWIEGGLEGWQATGAILALPYYLALKAEALRLADLTSEALGTISEAEAVLERREERWWCAELHRLRGVFLAALGADQTQIETSFRAAISTAKEQKSVSLQKRAEQT